MSLNKRKFRVILHTYAELSKSVALVKFAMALQVHYKYKQQVPDESQRKTEGVKVRKKYPAKIPVSFRTLVLNSIWSRDVFDWGCDHREGVICLASKELIV